MNQPRTHWYPSYMPTEETITECYYQREARLAVIASAAKWSKEGRGQNGGFVVKTCGRWRAVRNGAPNTRIGRLVLYQVEATKDCRPGRSSMRGAALAVTAANATLEPPGTAGSVNVAGPCW